MDSDLKWRMGTDAFVALVHIVAVSAVWTTHKDFADTKAGEFLLIMESITIVFHVGYVVLLNTNRLKADNPNRLKWLEYAASATIGSFALAYANGSPKLPTSTQILLAGAGVAQQCSGFQLEGDSGDKASVFVAYFSALGLQIGEFAVVYLALSDGIDLYGARSDITWLAYSTYVVGYSLFGVLMLLWLNADNETRNAKFERLYSLAGLVAKLGLVLSELVIFESDFGGAVAILVIECLLSVAIFYFGVRFVWLQ